VKNRSWHCFRNQHCDRYLEVRVAVIIFNLQYTRKYLDDSSQPYSKMVEAKRPERHRNGLNLQCCLLLVVAASLSAIVLSIVAGTRIYGKYNDSDSFVMDYKAELQPQQTNVYDWPGIAVEEIGHELVRKGSNFVDDARELFLQYLDEFLLVYEARPDKVNLCGIRINHAYALFLTIKVVQPTSIIESGVNAGQSTYFMRAASPDAHIYAIDPLDKPICGQPLRWIDSAVAQNKSTYYTGSAFQDFGDIDWASKIISGDLDPQKTLVFLDDHLKVFDRWNTLLKYGFRHVLLEDNYKDGEGATADDKAGWTPKQMFARQDSDAQFLWNSLDSYAEFPPLVAPILSSGRGNQRRKPAGGFLHHLDRNHDIVPPLLRPENDKDDQAIYERICRRLGLDPKMLDKDSYMQILNYNQFAYMEVRPGSPRLFSIL
jgi:hypothetical protein